MTDAAARRLPEFIKTLRINRAARRESVYAADNVYALLDALDTAEARVRELEAELAAMEARAISTDLAVVKAAKVATAETIERCAKVADELVHADPTYDDFLDGFRAGARTSAAAIRKLAQEELK